ncbi:thiamine phosphate synthase [Aquidulcibacter sp.]|uniref:thiamine phosphate synthase n=1 Tax=Aquidulcibacter sp. TaxID=2052990 RepID=UPI0037BEC7BA
MPRLLAALRSFRKPLKSGYPRLVVLTDDGRGYHLARQSLMCPPEAILIERTYGKKATPKSAAKGRQPVRLATISPREARQAGLDGVHWPEKRLRLRRRSAVGGLIETASAHRGLSIAKAKQQGVRAILLSVAFPSQSPSASRPGASSAKGPIRLAFLQKAFPSCDLYGLGGIQSKTTRQLARSGLYGVALISGLTE